MENGKNRNEKVALRKIGRLIKFHPLYVASALKHSDVFIENPYNKRELVDKVAENLATNRKFIKNIGLVVALNEAGRLNELDQNGFSNIGGRYNVDTGEQLLETGKKIGSGAASGKDPITVIIGAVVGAIDATFSWLGAKKKSEIDKERYKRELISEIYEKPKTNWTPILIVGGVLIVAAVVTFYTLKEE